MTKIETKPLQSFPPLVRNGWIIKMSILNASYVLLVLESSKTGEVVIRYLNGEAEALKFIEEMDTRDPSIRYNKRFIEEN